MAQDSLSAITSNIYIQRIPPNAPLPHLRVIIDNISEHPYARLASDISAQMHLTLACSLSENSEQLTVIGNALTSELNQKQLVFQGQSTRKIIQCWLENHGDLNIEHDQIELTTDWQLRSL